MNYPQPEVREVIGYLSPNGEYASFICPYTLVKRRVYLAGMKSHLHYVNDRRYVQFVKYTSEKFPVWKLAELRNKALGVEEKE